jgi:hypothetical protein
VIELDSTGCGDRAHQRPHECGLAGAVATDEAAHIAFE